MSCTWKRPATLAVVIMLLTSCAPVFAGEKCARNSAVPPGADQKNAAPDIVDTAVKAGSFKTLAAALQAAGLVETLKGSGPFTVFAPTDEAFDKLPAGTVESLLKPENKDKLVAILTYHVVAGKVQAADVIQMKSAKTVQGQSVTVDTTEGVKINDAKVVKTDIACANGVIHVIDTVLLPPETPLDIVDTAVKAAGLVETLKGEGPFTVFAPTDEAFAKLPAGTVESLLKQENKDKLIAILTYHVVAGNVKAADVVKLKSAETVAGSSVKITVADDAVRVNDAHVVKTDIACGNGVIHVIDTVLLPKE